VLAGACQPPLAACIRALWPSLLRTPDLRDTAYALEAALQELFFVAGPLLVAVIVAFVSPGAAVVATALAALGGALAFATAPASRGARGLAAGTGRTRGLGALQVPGVRTILLVGVAMGCVFGALEIGAPAFAEERGGREAGGIVLATVSLGSLLGGLWAGSRTARSPQRRYRASLVAFALALPLLLLADSVLALALLGLLAGLPIAPAFGAAYGLIDDLAPQGTRTEAFALKSTSIVAGVAVGTALAGVGIAQTDATAALVVAATAGALALLTVLAGRRTLAPDHGV
jgi:predicted MFS family arabinose efflux permease